MKKMFLLFLFFVGLNFHSEELFCTQEKTVSYRSKFDELSKIKMNWRLEESEIESKLHDIFKGLKEISRSHSVSEEKVILQFFEQKHVFVSWYLSVINTSAIVSCLYEERRKNIDKCINIIKKLLGQELFTKVLNIVFVKNSYGYHLYHYKRELRTTALDVFCKRLGGGWDFELGDYYGYVISKLIECGAKKYEELNTGIPSERVIYDYTQ